MPARYQSAPTMQAHMKTPSTSTAPRSSRTRPRSARVPVSIRITRSLVRIHGFGAHEDRGQVELYVHARSRAEAQERAGDTIGEADTTRGVDFDADAHL